MILGKWNKSVILTYIGMISAVAGIVFAFTCERINLAMSCLMISGVCDLFDGMVARMCRRTEEEKAFGIELDSLVDVISFIALPVAIALKAGLTEWWYIALFAFFAVSGIARLAYFNVVDADSTGPVKYYTGLPVTYTALILPLVYLIRLVADDVIFKILFASAYLLISVFGILKIKVIKPKGVWYGLFGLLAIGLLVVYLAVI